ncbi:MAG: Fe-S cluster assembly ATPase SufC [Candidatus Glassbacteria bacterium]
MSELLTISDLHVEVAGNPILEGVDLTVPKGEVHAIMGPNGSGKSTLANAIMGHPEYSITGGDIIFGQKSILKLPTDERARLGIFLSFQYPVALPGVSLLQLIKKSTSLISGSDRYRNAKAFTSSLQGLRGLAGIPPEMLTRSVNDGFSGGEMKKAEILQMGMLESRLIVLDEIDSGLDIDALKGVAEAINSLRDGERSFLIITHYQRILSHIFPDRVHVIRSGRIVRSGDASLALELEKAGYVDLEAAS